MSRMICNMMHQTRLTLSAFINVKVKFIECELGSSMISESKASYDFNERCFRMAE